jgi:hypothetical protein
VYWKRRKRTLTRRSDSTRSPNTFSELFASFSLHAFPLDAGIKILIWKDTNGLRVDDPIGHGIRKHFLHCLRHFLFTLSPRRWYQNSHLRGRKRTLTRRSDSTRNPKTFSALFASFSLYAFPLDAGIKILIWKDANGLWLDDLIGHGVRKFFLHCLCHLIRTPKICSALDKKPGLWCLQKHAFSSEQLQF